MPSFQAEGSYAWKGGAAWERYMKKRISFAVRGYYFCYFAAQACMASYLNVYLEQSLGFDGSALGRFNGLTALAPVAVLPAVGYWADRSGRGGWMLTAALGAVLWFAGSLGVQTGLAGALAWGSLWEIARSVCVSLADKRTMDLCAGQDGHYGAFRGFGSLGFLAGGMALGFAARRWALERVLFPAYLTLVFLALLLSFSLHRGERRRAGRGADLRQAGALLRSDAFRLALVLGVQGSVAVSALQPYLGSHLVSAMGAEETLVSWNTLVCVGPELLLLPLMTGKLLPRLGFRRVCLLTCLGLSVRCAIYALAPTPGVFLVGSLFYGLSVCGYTAVNLAFLRQAVPERLYATGVLVCAAVSALGRALFAWLFGALYQHWGSGSIFWLLLALSLGTTALVWRAKCLRE